MTALENLLDMPENIRVRFWHRIDFQPNGCWIHRAAVDHNGYGRVFMRGYAYSTYRVAYIWIKGPVPEGLVLDHLCRDRRCVNPDHLEAVTQDENVRRGERGRQQRTHCKYGHEYTPDNTRWIARPGKPPFRDCHECRLRYKREAYQKQRQRVALELQRCNP